MHRPCATPAARRHTRLAASRDFLTAVQRPIPCFVVLCHLHKCILVAGIPAWLPPWNSTAARQASLEEQCPHHRVPTGYANATLCGSNAPSPLLAASMASGLAPTPCAPCVYNPVPGPNASDITAWRFDQDNQCWMQVRRFFWDF